MHQGDGICPGGGRGVLIELHPSVLTPHVAGWTEESLVKLSSVLADKILGHEKAPADGQGFSP